MKIIGIGDSIMAYNDCHTFPQTGWLQMLPLYIKPECKIEVINRAKNGRSTKSFIEEGLFKDMLKFCVAGDLVIVSFGHNDEKLDEERHTDPYATYDSNLIYMIDEIRQSGAVPILATSWPRLCIDDHGKIVSNHGEYPRAMTMVGNRKNVPVIDLLTPGLNLLNKLGGTNSENLFMCLQPGIYPNYPQGKRDTSHLRPEGAMYAAGIFVAGIKEYSEFAKYFY